VETKVRFSFAECLDYAKFELRVKEKVISYYCTANKWAGSSALVGGGSVGVVGWLVCGWSAFTQVRGMLNENFEMKINLCFWHWVQNRKRCWMLWLKRVWYGFLVVSGGMFEQFWVTFVWNIERNSDQLLYSFLI